MGLLLDSAFAAYALAGRLSAPLVACLLRRRVARGKEEPARLPERWGHATLPRPSGPLLWLHAASVGESLAVLPLIEAIRAGHPHLAILMTSGTVTSARLLAERLPPQALHQYAPLDLPQAVRRFLEHWQPSLALFVESELWPTTLRALAKQRVPLALVNARMSDRSYRKWRRIRPLARSLLSACRMVLAEGPRSAARFRVLGAAEVVAPGNLKAAAEPLAVEIAELERLRAALGGRSCWVAASTHAGEEAIVLAAHGLLASRFPDLLTILAPRHPERGEALAELGAGAGLSVARRGAGALPGHDCSLYLCDTLGELGLVYRLAEVVFVGGSLVPKGGQNLLEPARLGRALLAGPYTENFAGVADHLEATGALRRVRDAASLAAEVAALLGDDARRAAAMAAAEAGARTEARVLEQTLSALEPLLAGAGRTAS